jgi:hypothetical protein
LGKGSIVGKKVLELEVVGNLSASSFEEFVLDRVFAHWIWISFSPAILDVELAEEFFCVFVKFGQGHICQKMAFEFGEFVAFLDEVPRGDSVEGIKPALAVDEQGVEIGFKEIGAIPRA